MSDNSLNSFPDSSQFITAVAELSIQLRKAADLATVCSHIHQAILPLLGKGSDIYLFDPTQNIFHPPSHQFKTLFKARSQHSPAFLSLNDLHLTSSVLPSSVILNHTTDTIPSNLKETGNRSHLLIPIIDEDDITAIIYYGRKKVSFFDNNHINSMVALAAIIGSKLKDIDVIETLQTSVSSLEYTERLRSALYEINEQAQSSAKIEDIYSSFHHIVGRLIHARNFFIALVEKTKNGPLIHFPYYLDSHDFSFQGQTLSLDHGKERSLTGYLLESGKPLLTRPDNFKQICEDNKITFLGTEPYSWLGVPFYLEHISGAVVVQSYKDVVYTEKDKSLLIYVARHVGNALQHKKSIDDLRKTKDQAETAEQNKSAFLATMSHEIRTPMNGIIGITELVLETKITDQQRSYLKMVKSSADRLLLLINDILDFSKIEAGKLEIRAIPFHLRSTVDESLNMLIIQAGQKDIALTHTTDNGVPNYLTGDPNRLCQVIVNLVNNAIKFTESGEIHIQVTTDKDGEKEHLKGTTRLCFSVSDTGIGINAAHQEKIFAPFSQAHNVKDENYGGTGLGLVVSAQLVEMMGGRIWVESSPENGSCFHFTAQFETLNSKPTNLPMEKPTLEERAPEKKKNIHILLAEDDPINKTLAVAVLEHEGWQVTAVTDGIKVIEQVDSNNYDLILMDIQMPEMDGYEATRIIRKKEHAQGTYLPIIAMTAHAVKGDREKCLRTGMDGYISKPIDRTLLKKEIDTVLYKNNT